MNIGIDFHSAEREGSGNCTYIRNLVEAIVRLDQVNSYFLYVTDKHYQYFDKFKANKNVFIRPIAGKSPFVRIPLLGLSTFKDKIDVLHVQYIAPPLHRGRLLLMVHDLAFLHFPECFGRFERYRSRLLIPWNAKRAVRILTVSHYSKKDIASALQVPDEKIEVTYNGIDQTFSPICDGDALRKIHEQYGIRERYILSVGRLDPRKNLLRMIQAFAILKRSYAIPHKLVIVGKKDYLSSEIENAICKSADGGKDILRLGYVPTEHLPFLYRGADVFVYPTLFEGFGLPCLEAMACGCAVVSSNNTSIPEVVGDAAKLIDPTDTNELVEAVHAVLADHELRSSMQSKGIQRAKIFAWENTARQMREVYEAYGNQ